MKRFLFTIISLLVLTPFNNYGQLSKADSTFFNTIFAEQPYISYWNYPGNWYHRNEPTSLANLYEQIDSNFIFYNEEYIDCYPKIKVNSILERDTLVNQSLDNFADIYKKNLYDSRSPFVKLKYELNGKTAYAYAALDSTTKVPYNTDVAYVIFSGTGANGIAEIIAGTGYHNDNCKIVSNLKPKGDVYVLNCPNEEQRAIIFNKKKLTSTSNYTPPFLISYLNAENKALGITRLIESAAMIKFLKTKYKKVYVLGLSTGGKVALWVTMISSPDASIISSGYSILVDNDYNSQFINNLMYGTYLKVLDKDSTKNRIKQLSTQILFTLPQNDAPISQLDIDSQYTKTFYSDVGNTSFFYDYYLHAFPPCNTIDTFFGRCNKMAKVFLSVDTNLCNKDSLILNINFYGKGPYTYQVYNENNLVGNYYCSTNDTSIHLFDEGKYIIKNIIDSSGTLGFFSDTIYYIKKIAPTMSVTSHEWLCDSLKQKVIIESQGISPFKVYYSNGLQTDSILINGFKDSVFLSYNQYNFNKINDASNCFIDTSILININNPQLSANINSVQYNCLLDKNKITLNVQGKYPMLFYFYDSTNHLGIVDTIFNSPYSKMLESGVYYFSKITDNNSCIYTLDSVLELNSSPIHFSNNNSYYECSKDYSVLPIKLNGRPPLNITLEHNGSQYLIQKNNYSDTLHLQKGITKLISVKDDNNCNFNTNNITFNNSYQKLSANINPFEYDCNTEQKGFQLITNGNYPITIYGKSSLENFITKTLDDTTILWAKSGNYQIDSIVDNNACKIAIGYNDEIKNDTSISPLSIQGMEIISDAVSSKNYIWYLNGEKLIETDNASIPVKQNGVYQMAYYNNNQCLIYTPSLLVELDDLIIYPNPINNQFSVYINISKKDKVTMKIINSMGEEISSYILKDGRNDFIFPSQQKGVYILHFESNSKSIKYLDRRIIKR